MPSKNTKEDNRLFELDWPVCQSGYKILRATDPIPQSVTKEFIFGLTDKRYYDEIIPVSDVEGRKYNPFIECPGIAKEFSCIPFDPKAKELDHDAVLKFSRKYGLLGIEHPNGKHPEKLKDWYEYVSLFFEIYGLLSMGFLEHATMIFNNFGPSPKFSVSIASTKKKYLNFLEIKPTSLLGAMWMILANDIGKGCDLQSCENAACGVWFSRKANKRFCSDACKMAWHRSLAK